MKIKFCCLPGILQKQRKFVASFVYKIDKIPVKDPSLFNYLAWETSSQLNSRIVIRFSGSDGLNGIRTQAKHFLGPRELFLHLPMTACVLNVWAPPFLITVYLGEYTKYSLEPHWLFYESKYRSGRGRGLLHLWAARAVFSFSLCYLKTSSRSVKAQWYIIVYKKTHRNHFHHGLHVTLVTWTGGKQKKGFQLSPVFLQQELQQCEQGNHQRKFIYYIIRCLGISSACMSFISCHFQNKW